MALVLKRTRHGSEITTKAKVRMAMQSNPAEAALLEYLDGVLRRKRMRQSLDEIVERVVHNLDQDTGRVMAWEPVPLDAYGAVLPAVIRSSWIFVLRGGSTTGPERHPNSIQRVVSYRGTGDLQTKAALEDVWSSHVLECNLELPVERRWLFIPRNMWHQAVVPNQHWAVVSFHTAGTHELIEERPDPANSGRQRQTLYVAKPESTPAIPRRNMTSTPRVSHDSAE